MDRREFSSRTLDRTPKVLPDGVANQSTTNKRFNQVPVEKRKKRIEIVAAVVDFRRRRPSTGLSREKKKKKRYISKKYFFSTRTFNVFSSDNDHASPRRLFYVTRFGFHQPRGPVGRESDALGAGGERRSVRLRRARRRWSTPLCSRGRAGLFDQRRSHRIVELYYKNGVCQIRIIYVVI